MDDNSIYARASGGTGSARVRGGSSLSGLLWTLIPTLLIAVVVFAVFLILRPKSNRVYQPRSLNTFVSSHDKTPGSEDGMFAWVSNYRSIPDSFALQHNSLDNFLYIRFFKLMVIICFVGCCITWPILFPVYATAGGGQKQLDILSFSNTKPSYRYFAPCLVAWVFLGFVVFAITRERMFFIGLRQAYFMSSFHAQRLSSRTVVFLGLPKQTLEEAQIRQVFGPSIRKIWMVSNCQDLEDKMGDRNKEFAKLEGAQVKLITESNNKRLKGKSNVGADGGEGGAARWIDPKDRPSHRLKVLKFLPIGKKVDTINYCSESGPRMAAEIERSQHGFLDGTGEKAPAAFVEFQTQAAAQRAYQLVAQGKRSEYHPRYIGVTPNEVVWKNLGMGNSSRKSKMAIATTFISLLILFWSIPVAVVGAISNINYLTDKVHFLSFINSIPAVILGVVTGLLPVVLLAVLMSLVPIICRALAKWAGEPTLSRIELRTQSWYFAFQLIQVFLVTTFASGAASVATQIVRKPARAPTLLAENLPKASNFYIDYLLLFGLSASAMLFLNIGPFVMLTIVGKFLDKTPRKQYNRWLNLPSLGWGSMYPVYTNLGVISITYSCIAPLILGFATIGLGLLYLGFRYNVLFTLGNQKDTHGECYNRALQHLMWGVYLASFCLIGLFAIGTAKSNGAIGPLVLMVIFLVAVVIFNVLVGQALGPLEHTLPLDILQDNEKSVTLLTGAEEGKMNVRYENMQAANVDRNGQLEDGATTQGSGSEKAPAPEKKQKESFLTRFARPYVHKSYESNKALLGNSEATNTIPEYVEGDIDEAYHNPSIISPRPMIWLARDQMGISQMFAMENRKVGIETSDEGASYNDKGKIDWDHENVEGMPVWREVQRARGAQEH